MKYKGISPRERKLIEEITQRNLTIFTPIDASNILKETRENTYRILSRMEHKNIIHRIEKGKYIYQKKLQETHIYKIACHIIEPSYLSLWSALHYYKYTTQVPRIIYLITTTPKKSIKIQNQKIKFIKTQHFFGYTKENDLIIAEPEKLFLDCLQYPYYAGGIEQIKNSLQKAKIKPKKIIKYALKINNKSLNSRLGYLLSLTHQKITTKTLKKHLSQTYIPLDPSLPKKGTKNNEWKIIDNTR